MTLEDFFTLTEMKNGLATVARVEELISTMQQQQKDCLMNNVGDTTRQWSTVASTLAATESKDCLHHFVKLNGLCFLDQWLQEGLKCSNNIGDSAVEELMHVLLGSLERLPINREQSIASGIHMTIEQLLAFKGPYQERAISLREKWKHAEEKVVNYQDNANDGFCGDGEPKCISVIESVGTETHNSDDVAFRDATRLDSTNDVLPTVTNRTTPKPSADTADACADVGNKKVMASSPVSNAGQEHTFRTYESSDTIGSHVDAKTCDLLFSDDGTAKAMKMEMDGNEGQQDHSKVVVSSSLSASSPAQKPGRSVSCNFDFREYKFQVSEKIETLPRSASIDCVASNGLKLNKEDNLETSIYRKEIAQRSEAKDLDIGDDLVVSRVDSSNRHGSSEIGKIDQRSELEDGEIDALEVARQVAIEVEREVVDYREPFCSPSPEGSSGEVILAQSSLTVEKFKHDQPIKEEVNGLSSSAKDENKKKSEMEVESVTCENKIPKRLTCAYESTGKSDQPTFDFDLNEDIDNEEYDCLLPNNSVGVSVPVAVAASKGSPLLPVAPICFEGEQCWKGSAVTSAFRSASPRRTDAENTYSGKKRKSSFLEFDLNVVDIGDDDDDDDDDVVSIEPVTTKATAQGDSMEITSRRADRLNLDLNRLGDEDVAPDQLSYWRLPHRNGEQTLSSASSSSSRQPCTRDFDLNDNPGFFDAKATSIYDVAAITIMGSRMAVERNDFLNDTRRSSMGNGHSHIQLPTYMYNGPAMGPPMPFAPSAYGPGSFPYTVDSRGTTAIPHVVGHAGVHGAPLATPSFLMSVPNAASTLDAAGSSRSFLSLNSGMQTMETTNRDGRSLKHVFMQRHNGVMENR